VRTFGDRTLGILVDLSHTSDATMLDVFNITLAQVIFSHSNSRALCEDPRIIPDNVLHLWDGGVAMVTFEAEYINEERIAF